MKTSRLRTSRGGPTSLVLWALLTTATCLELYEDVPAEVDPPNYQDENSLDTGPLESQRRIPDLALAKDVLLYRLIRSLQRDAPSRNNLRFSPNWPAYPHHREVPPVPVYPSTDVVVKRLTKALRASPRNPSIRSVDHRYRPQQKWKIKKGRSLGSQMVCYFKLCAFRSPL